MVSVFTLILLCIITISYTSPVLSAASEEGGGGSSKHPMKRRVIDVRSGPEEVVWVVQLSDLHFSIFHPDRAMDFQSLLASALSMINPALILVTGDLTDGKSKDMLIMKQNEEEWMQYKNVVEDVVKRSHLDKDIFYDLRGNHDSFGVPLFGGSYDFFLKYSINGQLGRSRKVNSVTLETTYGKHLFVGFESTMSEGLRGPTNLFGHPTDELLSNIDSELSQWDSESEKTVTKFTFGHFPISFSAASTSGKRLDDIFLKHSLSAYLCGHLHTRFGKNLKRHHQSSLPSRRSFQLNSHHIIPSEKIQNCSIPSPPVKEFWEWEMGDWRKGRAMRILAIDRGAISFLDIDFKSGAQTTIILPTFPPDSRFLSTTSPYKYKCQDDPSSYNMIRTLIFSVSPITLVVARIYDSNIIGHPILVLEAPMSKQEKNSSRGDLYSVAWDFKAFEDSSPDRFSLQIETVDILGRSCLSELRPFSVNGLSAKLSWTWKEFFVMGCQWDALYNQILWITFSVIFLFLVFPKALSIFLKHRYNYTAQIWIATELCSITVVWFGMFGYLLYVVLFPWFFGKAFADGGERGYMTCKGWIPKTSNGKNLFRFVGFPDIMVVVLPHLLFVFLPAVLLTGAFAVERGVYRMHYLAYSGKKDDDNECRHGDGRNRRSRFYSGKRWIRFILILGCFAICWKHYKICRSVLKAYEMNPFLHAPLFTFSIPVFLAYAACLTSNV